MRDMIYVGMGEEVALVSDDPVNPSKFYLLSAPAHQAHPTALLTVADAKRLDLGSQATSNERSIFHFTNNIKTCQLVVGMTQLALGSVWNTMPCDVRLWHFELHVHLGDGGRQC